MTQPHNIYFNAKADIVRELGEQAYDSVDKALRELVMNAKDAGASTVTLDLTEVVTERRARVFDDGAGMTAEEFEAQYMALGGSDKAEGYDYFGRKGIGGKAILSYASRATITSKVAGAADCLVVELSTEQFSDRRRDLADQPAGTAREEPYRGAKRDHFTEIVLEEVLDPIYQEVSSEKVFDRLIDRLRRVLPLPLPDGDALVEALRTSAPEVARRIEKTVRRYAIEVEVLSPFSAEPIRLTRRQFGSGGRRKQDERWADVRGFEAPLPVSTATGDRVLRIFGYFVDSEEKVPGEWRGLCARLQSAAVEENTFFGYHQDAGARAYLTGEVFIGGEFDRQRLVAIDRSRFQRDSADYRAIEGFLKPRIGRFVKRIQRRQRWSVDVKRILDRYKTLAWRVRRVGAAFEAVFPGRERLVPQTGVVSPIEMRGREFPGIVERLTAERAKVVRDPELADAKGERLPYEIGPGRTIRLHPEVYDLQVEVGGHPYEVELVAGGSSERPVKIFSRGSKIRVDLDHPALGGLNPDRVQTALLMEVALQNSGGAGEQLVVDFLRLRKEV